jgi:hypothetical protein
MRAPSSAGSALRTYPRRFWRVLQQQLAGHPSLYLPLAMARFKPELTVGPHTEIVIEGFPCSANTFAVEAFRLAQPRPARIAHHLHVSAQFIRAVRRDIPVLLLIREPEEAILSLVVRERFLSLRQATGEYVRYYQRALPLRDRLVVATFQEVTRNFGAVIREVNRRFGVSFGEFDHTEANVQLVFEVIDRQFRKRVAPSGVGAEDLGTMESRLERRKAQKEALRTLYRETSGELGVRADRVYALLASGAVE